MERLKQVIILRKDLGMRKGKMVAQGAHASQLALEEANRRVESVVSTWINRDGMAKICVGTDSLDELLLLKEEASRLGIPFGLVTDSGLTEFHGNPTVTALCLGPAQESLIDRVTGELKLL